MTIQDAIDLAIEKNSNVSILCSLTNEEIRLATKEGKGCGIFWDTGQKSGKTILIVPPAFMDTLGATGPVIAIPSPDKTHRGQD